MAAKKVANNTPLALYSLLMRKNPKNAARFGKAPRLTIIHMLSVRQ